MKKIALLLLVVVTFFDNSKAQSIITIAGGGSEVVCTTCGDGGPATAAFVYGPWGICLDQSGGIYTSDVMHARIRTVDGSGTINGFAGNSDTTFLGDGGPATAAGMQPRALVSDLFGNIYVCDGTHARIRRIDPTGTITTIAGNGGSGYTGDGGLATAAQIGIVSSITVDPSGNLYLTHGNVIRKVNTGGIISTIADTGVAGFSGDGGPALEAQLHFPGGIALDDTGNIYVSDNFRIRKINQDGIINTIAGTGAYGYTGDGGPASAATFKLHNFLATDALNNIYISDEGTYTVRKINSAGIIITVAGSGVWGYGGDGGPATTAQFRGVKDIALDSAGNLYICDNGNNRVRMVHSNNHMPSFTAGHSMSMTVCEGAAPVSLNSMLAATDVDAGQTVQWLLSVAPQHGSAAISYTTTATGGTLTPVGLSYTPSAGYWGNDTFTVRVDDGISAYKTTVYVTVLPFHAGIINGEDSVCTGSAITLTDTTAGGNWSGSDATLATVSSGGVVTGGTATGTVTITYTVSNSCGTIYTTYPVTVHNSEECATGIAAADVRHGLYVFPNPASGSVSLRLSSGQSEDMKVTISDVAGRVLAAFDMQTNTDETVELDRSGFAPGVYMLQTVTGSGVWRKSLLVK